MKMMSRLALAVLAVLFAAPPGFSIHIEGVRYAKPPSRPSISSWPEGLAAVIADTTYLDGFNYQNPGYVIENIDTFYYGGDTEALNLFLEKLAKVKGVRVNVVFSNGVGKVNRDMRAETVWQQKMLDRAASEIEGPSCTWLVSVTPKDWVRLPKGVQAESEARVLIFLGGKQIDLEKLRLPAWGN